MNNFSSFFKRKNKIEDRLKKINILKISMRQNEALNETKALIHDIIENPKLINQMNNFSDFGNFLTQQLNNFEQTNELQFITELAFFVITKDLTKDINPHNLFDRLVIMYNAEDFLSETIIEANNLKYNPLDRFGSKHHIKWMAEDMLLKMRFHDLFHENKFYRAGSNDNSFNGQEFIEISKMIKNGKFESKSVDDIVKKGKDLINICYSFIANKYSFDI